MTCYLCTFSSRRHIHLIIPLPAFMFLMCSLWVYNIGWNHSKYILLNPPSPSLTLIWSVNLVKFIFVFLLISLYHNKAFLIFHLDYCSDFLTDLLATNPSYSPLPDLFFSIQSAHVFLQPKRSFISQHLNSSSPGSLEPAFHWQPHYSPSRWSDFISLCCLLMLTLFIKHSSSSFLLGKLIIP